MNAPLSVDHFQSSLLGGFAVALGDDWKWATDKGAFIIKWLYSDKDLGKSAVFSPTNWGTQTILGSILGKSKKTGLKTTKISFIVPNIYSVS